ncbi:tetratricopeptide repeat protein [Streptomyces litchfieldiae]|uniref:Tetratricopeptide repeat protein n=1 Tax=Streptomyces litchfieldiae TaxID=3075543 RepID=A0ABU2MZZ8_9ACTN|nr:tetratricopeptide repeat protein [Streptomyces sp. DSM 44938]MDT0347222.1 tetratricopeptide repeat protein [Streptomyces sp. DSM 44938]
MAVIGGYHQGIVRRRGRVAALLNASGLGAGYLYLRQWSRAVASWLVTLLIVVLANALNASDTWPFWLGLYALWLVAMTVDGYRRARLAALPDAAAPPLRPWLPLAVGAVVIALVATGLAFYRAVPAGELDRAERAHAAGDCATAVEHYDRAAAGRYEFTLSGALADARAGRAACDVVLTAEAAAEAGDFPAAISGYGGYLDRYAGTPPWDGAGPRLAELRLAHADALAGTARETGGEELSAAYRTAFEAYLAVREEHPASPQAAQVPGRFEDLYANGTAGLADRPCETVGDLLALESLSSVGAPEAADLSGRATRALPGARFACGEERVEAGEFCAATDEFEAVLGLSAASGEQRHDAENSAGHALYECGLAHYEGGDLGPARDAFQRLVDGYPDDARAGGAGELLIAVEIDEINAGDTGELPPPTATGGAPGGTVTVEIVNDSPEELEILFAGAGTGTASVDACGDCTPHGGGPLGDQPGGTCGTDLDRPRVTLTLAPGDYRMVVRATTDSTVAPHSGDWYLTSGTAYSGCYHISASDL